MTTDSLSNVEAWFNAQTAKGLVDIKLCVTPGAEVSVSKIQQKLLQHETSLSSGHRSCAPAMTRSLPAEIEKKILAVSL
ncbi:MAG: hypothetical protein RLZZ123_395 [Pseudomonadota bacterium]|jgi:hypothetical protein